VIKLVRQNCVRKVTVLAERVNILELIKLDLESYVGKRVKLKANRGRRKVIEAEGVIENTYPKIFVVKLDKSHSVRRMSYTYADVLTKTVELTVDDNIIGDVEVANL